jgi:hypothetical protein
MITKKIPLTLSIIIFYIGVLVGLTLTTVAAWGDLEAASYGFDQTGGERLNTLYCPILMTANETSSFSIKVTNTTKGKLSPSIKTDISSRLAPISSSITHITTAPGETKQPEWMVGPENLDLKQFIFARALIYGAYPLPNRENTCGILVVNLPTNGMVITWTMAILSLLGVGIGLFGVTKFKYSVQRGLVDMLRFNLLAILVIAGLITGFLGWWIQGVIVIVISLLLLVVSFFTIKR